jgi:hypothetical protein
MEFLLILLCAVTGFTDPETGSTIPEDISGQGFFPVEQPGEPGIGEWTAIGPWGGNLRPNSIPFP